ncbi:AsnC family transcriptional regulator [Salinisphaera sp. PC39]|uniref:MarR family EPS-associated transcriptional regulator n=1 Tax=Salinisphaera sp. PC39 TaxID=1304156 RepID=UPI003340F0B0
MNERTISDETRYRLLRMLADNPALSQRDLANELGMSVGKVNYCLRALLNVGHIKAVNFKNRRNKRGYLYQLTPAGLAAKALAARRFLTRKQAEYERLAAEIEQLRRQAVEDEQLAGKRT